MRISGRWCCKYDTASPRPCFTTAKYPSRSRAVLKVLTNWKSLSTTRTRPCPMVIRELVYAASDLPFDSGEVNASSIFLERGVENEIQVADGTTVDGVGTRDLLEVM